MVERAVWQRWRRCDFLMFDGLDQSVVPFYVGAEAWPMFAERLRPHIKKMADGSDGRYLAEDITALIAWGHMQVWLALDGADIACMMVTEVVKYPRCSAMRCIGVVGHRPRRWMHLMSTVEVAAKEHFGCSRMEALHQPGHERLLTTGGWKVFHYLSEKPL